MPDGWYFTSHFPDDPVLAGSLVAEGAVQLLEVYALSLGLHLSFPDARFQPVPDLRTEVKVRGQITPEHEKIEYRVDITSLTLVPRPSITADVSSCATASRPSASPGSASGWWRSRARPTVPRPGGRSRTSWAG